MSKRVFPSDNEIRSLQEKIDSGILLAQRRLVERAKREGFTLITCPHGQVIEISPESVCF